MLRQCGLPGGKWSDRCPKAGHSSGPPLPKSLIYEFALGGGVYPPERALPWLFLRTGHFDEVPVQRQVVTNRVLQHTNKRHENLLEQYI